MEVGTDCDCGAAIRSHHGTALPLELDFLVLNPATTTTGDLYVADLEGLYSPRPPVPYVYTAEPKNPPWLQFDENPARFAPGGVTVAAFGDSHLSSTDENSTGAVVTADIGADLAGLPANAAPNEVQVDGNLADPGTVSDLDFAQSLLNSFGIPYHTAVGDSDIGQDAYPENVNWTSVFGPTHGTGLGLVLPAAACRCLPCLAGAGVSAS